MSESFEKWWNDQIAGAPVGVFATEEAMAKAAYLAGQASAKGELILRDQQIQRLIAENTELDRERDEAVRQWERFERMAGDNWAALKAQAGEPVAWQHRQRGLKEYEWQEWQTVGYKPQGPESQTFQMRPLFTHPTTERPYNPLNDYAVIPMPTTERRVIPEDVLSWIDGVLPVVEIFGTTPSQKQWSRDRTREARAWLNAAPAPTKESK